MISAGQIFIKPSLMTGIGAAPVANTLPGASILGLSVAATNQQIIYHNLTTMNSADLVSQYHLAVVQGDPARAQALLGALGT